MPPSASARRENLARRLRGAGAFEMVFASGRRLDGRFLQFIVAPAARPIGRVGYVIGRKAMPRAVDRNRLRRCLRVLLRDARPSIDAFDVVVRVRAAVTRDDIAAVTNEAGRLIRRIGPVVPAA